MYVCVTIGNSKCLWDTLLLKNSHNENQRNGKKQQYGVWWSVGTSLASCFSSFVPLSMEGYLWAPPPSVVRKEKIAWPSLTPRGAVPAPVGHWWGMSLWLWWTDGCIIRYKWFLLIIIRKSISSLSLVAVTTEGLKKVKFSFLGVCSWNMSFVDSVPTPKTISKISLHFPNIFERMTWKLIPLLLIQNSLVGLNICFS